VSRQRYTFHLCLPLVAADGSSQFLHGHREWLSPLAVLRLDSRNFHFHIHTVLMISAAKVAHYMESGKQTAGGSGILKSQAADM
jgi:hypothetical protein